MLHLVATQTRSPSLDMRIDGKTASKLRWTKVTGPDPGPQYAVTPEDDEFACMVEVPTGPMFGFGGGKVCAGAVSARRSSTARPASPAAWVRFVGDMEASFQA